MIRTATTARLPRGASSVTAYVALLALAVLQLGMVLHHDQHSATELTGTCTACVQLEQFDDLLPATGAEFVTRPADPVVSASIMPIVAPLLLRPYHSRAPPARS